MTRSTSVGVTVFQATTAPLFVGEPESFYAKPFTLIIPQDSAVKG